MPALQQSQAETTIRCCSEIVRRLLEAHDKGESVNLNALKTQVAKKYGAKVVPRLVDIISAVPQDVRDILLPKLRAKPVRTASGVRPFPPAPVQKPLEYAELTSPRLAPTDRRRRRHEQAAPVPAHRHDRQHLRVRSPFTVPSCRATRAILTVHPMRAQVLPRRARLGLRVLDPVLHRASSSLSWLARQQELVTDACCTLQGYEPTSMRAIRARYDPYEQSKGRVEQLRSLGHSVDKVRLAPLSPLLSLPRASH